LPQRKQIAVAGILVTVIIKNDYLIIVEPPALATPQDAALAVVRIRGCDASGNCIDTNQGSGTIIHPNGIILTAWHVTVLDLRNQALRAQSHFYG